MASRVLRRRAVTAAALYGGTAAGILGTLIAVRVLGPDQFGVFTLALATASFVQLLLDTTVEEAIVKYGFRYAATSDWGRLRGLFRVGLAVKWGGGAIATVVVLAARPVLGRRSSASPTSPARSSSPRSSRSRRRRRGSPARR